MPNATILAPVVMVAWIPFTLLLFWKFRPPIATTISIVGAGLFLPYRYAFDLPSLPPIDRESLAALTCLAAMLLFHRHRFAERLPLRGVEALVLIMLLGGLATVMTNRDVLDAGRISLPGLKPWDAMPFTARAVFIYWVPFYLGRLVFRDPRDLRDLFVVLAVLGVIYCLPILWEARMSPSLHYRVYGYHPAGFIMSKRELFFGWRPMVFVGTGLAVSMTMLMAAMSSWTLWRTTRGSEKRWLMAVSAGLSFFVFMCNSVGTILYLLLLSPVTALSKKRVQRAVLITGFVLVLFFPIFRASGLIPTDLLVRAAASYSESRAASLKYRFDNEDILLEKARERPLFGFGGYGRSRVYDPRTGRDLSVTDGYWIIVLGQRGAAGFLSVFGMMILPVLSAFYACSRRRNSQDLQWVMGAALMIVISTVDLLPNGSPTIRTILTCGALTGALHGWPALEQRRAARRRALRAKGDPPSKRRKRGRAVQGDWASGDPAQAPPTTAAAPAETLSSALIGRD